MHSRPPSLVRTWLACLQCGGEHQHGSRHGLPRCERCGGQMLEDGGTGCGIVTYDNTGAHRPKGMTLDEIERRWR